MTNKEIASEIIKYVGGEKNVSSLTHCATRLRFVLKDDKKADLSNLERVEGVLKAQNKGGQIQVVIGSKVGTIYQAILDNFKIAGGSETEEKKKFSFNTILETIAGIFTPVLPALIGCGMMKCITTVMTTLGWVDASSGFVTIINMIGNIVFYFMPFILAWSAANKFKTNVALALCLAGCLMHPTIMSAGDITSISFLGLPIKLMNYSSTVIPIILSVFVLSYVYRFFDKIIPSMVKVIFVPMLVLLVMVPVELIVLGPIGSYIGSWLGGIINTLFSWNGVIAGAVLGFFRPILVMFGMHYSIMPLQVQQVAEFGYSTMLPSAICANIAQAGAGFAVFVLCKRNATMKAAAGSASITALFGVTEPIIYGVNLKYKKPFFAACAGAGIASGLMGFFNASATAISLPGILALPTYQASSYIFVILGVLLAFALSFVFTYVLGINEDKEGTAEVQADNAVIDIDGTVEITSPIVGDVKQLSEVEDKVFSNELVGKGIAVEPSEGVVRAPFDGTVEVVMNTKHAIGLRSNEGIELLIHVGMDTVNLNGDGFTAHVEIGQKIKKGDILLEFDMAKIKAAGYSLITPVVVTNIDQFADVKGIADQHAGFQTKVLDVAR